MARTNEALSLPSPGTAPERVRHARVTARQRTRIDSTTAPAAGATMHTQAPPSAHRCAVCGSQERVSLRRVDRGTVSLCDRSACRRRHEASRLLWLNEAITLLAPVHDDDLADQLSRTGRSIATCGISSSR